MHFRNKIKLIIVIIILIIYLKIQINTSNRKKIETDYLEETITNNNDEKYIMFSCNSNDLDECGGWGDRVKGIMSAYWWSVLSGRKLILNINRPCDLSKILEPNQVNWNIKLNKTNIKNYSEITLNKFNDDIFKDELRFINLKKFHSDKNLIILKTNRNFVWSFAKTQVPVHIKTILNLGFSNTNEIDIPYTYRSVSSKLFKLTPKLDAYLRNFYTNDLKPNKQTTLICVQIRTRNVRNDPFKKDEIYLSLKELKKFWVFIEHLITKVENNNYKIFLAADNVKFRNYAIERFGPEKVVYNKGNNIENIDYIKGKNNECPAGFTQTFKDFYSFQYCDMAVTTQYSQFARFALWNKGNVPNFYYSYTGRNFIRIFNFSQQLDYTY